MKGKTKRKFKKIRIKDKKIDRAINKKNKDLMIEKILSYSPKLSEGIEKYEYANRNFLILISTGFLLINFPLIALPFCLLSIFFIVKMLQFIKYNSINTIVKRLAKDLSYKGIYDKGKVEDMMQEFKNKYGQEVIEYEELIKMVSKYETFVTKIEYVLKNINIEKQDDCREQPIALDKTLTSLKNMKKDVNSENNNKNTEDKLTHYYTDFNDKLSMLCKNENGEIRKINRAIEFFGDKDEEDTNAIILKSKDKNNKKLTVYLYKKSSDLQKNAL